MSLVFRMMPSPVGDLRLVAGAQGLRAVQFASVVDRDHRKLGAPVEAPDHPVLQAAEDQLAAYFAGRLSAFRLPLDLVGTDFQTAVWAALLRIPFGETRTYGQIARAIGQPGAMRAVGAAANRNPIAIVVPCHRVVGAAGTLTGFAGGLDAKIRLLEVEGCSFAPGTSFTSRVGGPRKSGIAAEPEPNLFSRRDPGSPVSA